MDNKNTYLSFVVTARNDNYGGNWINRINAFVKTLAYQAQRTETMCELILVEYNPIPDKPNLYQELNLSTNQYFNVRCVIVPNEFHKTIPNNEKVGICEFIGKNIGIRRASGEYIVATNPDTVYGDDIFDFFATRKLKNNTFYRINRKDTSVTFVDPKFDGKQIQDYVQKNVIKMLFNKYTQYVSYKTWFHEFIHGRTWRGFKQCPLFNSFKKIETNNEVIHENAAGDFLLMHRSMWEKVRGYDQVTVGSGVLDGYIMYVLYCHDYVQNILPYSIYHLYHHHKGVVYLASHTKFRNDANEMLRTKKVYKENSPDWGFPSEKFPEPLQTKI